MIQQHFVNKKELQQQKLIFRKHHFTFALDGFIQRIKQLGYIIHHRCQFLFKSEFLISNLIDIYTRQFLIPNQIN